MVLDLVGESLNLPATLPAHLKTENYWCELSDMICNKCLAQRRSSVIDSFHCDSPHGMTMKTIRLERDGKRENCEERREERERKRTWASPV